MKLHTILIVDDKKLNRTILHKILENDYDILEAENGQEALDILYKNAGTIAAVMLDIVMPVLDGYAVLQTMKADSVLSKIPVIVSSQKDGDEAEEKALKLGAQDFIAKPYKANIIQHRLNNTIRLRETAAMINQVERDELTGLTSQQFFLKNVADELKNNRDKKYDLVACDIERFKIVNDTYGIGKSDELLKYIAELLKSYPQILCSSRFTADHFYMLAEHREDFDKASIQDFIEKLNKFPIGMNIHMKFGIYQVENHDSEVIGMCDRALLAAGTNQGKYDSLFAVYDDAMRQKMVKEQFIVSNMHAALTEHQFQVYYQPKYDLNSRRIAGAEALVRWIHPTNGFMSPGEFIPLFERNGFITQMDEYVWESACRDIRSWMDKGYPPVAISVNVSRADAYNPKLADILLGLVDKYQIPIRYLHLEITESAYTDNPDQIIGVVNNLRRLGFIIEMDDFGSGYSSLNMLAKMPVDVLKLDIGFVQNETSNSSGRGILSFIISLAKWMNLAVVAEGVETAEQLEILRSMDCKYVQGYYFAKPMKKVDFDELLSESQVTEMVCGSQTNNKAAGQTAVIDSQDKVMLLVDDIEMNRAVLASMFEGWFEIVEKENGLAAWEYLQENYDRVAIVLLDLLMPVMDGFQLLDRIRTDEKTAELPVIITSQEDNEREEQVLKMQADDFISKPYNSEIIRHRVKNVLDSNCWRKLQQEKQLAGN